MATAKSDTKSTTKTATTKRAATKPAAATKTTTKPVAATKTTDATKTPSPANVSKTLLDALKAAGLKPTTKQAKRATRLLIDGKTVALLVTTAKGLRVYVKTDKLPAAIKGFAQTKGTGYACALNADDDKQLGHVVAAVQHASTSTSTTTETTKGA